MFHMPGKAVFASHPAQKPVRLQRRFPDGRAHREVFGAPVDFLVSDEERSARFMAKFAARVLPRKGVRERSACGNRERGLQRGGGFFQARPHFEAQDCLLGRGVVIAQGHLHGVLLPRIDVHPRGPDPFYGNAGAYGAHVHLVQKHRRIVDAGGRDLNLGLDLSSEIILVFGKIFWPAGFPLGLGVVDGRAFERAHGAWFFPGGQGRGRPRKFEGHEAPLWQRNEALKARVPALGGVELVPTGGLRIQNGAVLEC